MIELNKVELNHDDRCPCSSGEVYGACCGRFLGEFVASGTLTAPTPEQLMRSRFTAFATGNAAYLLASWHPSTRPATLSWRMISAGIAWIFWVLRVARLMHQVRWSSLRITVRGRAHLRRSG